MQITKLTPLTRLSTAVDYELQTMNDPALEAELGGKYLARVAEAAQRRDANLKSLVIVDAALAIAVSGRSFSIPGTDLKMSDIPALLEVLVGLASLGIFMSAMTFTTWLCYSQISFVFSNRTARKYAIDPDLLSLAEAHSEPTVKVLRSKLNIWGEDWHEPQTGFKVFSVINGLATALFFLAAPVLHIALLGAATWKIGVQSGFDVVHIVFYLWVFLSHLLAISTWMAPMFQFAFAIIPPQENAPRSE